MDKRQFLEKFYDLAKNYQPAQKVKDQIKNVELLIVVGPTGVGKTSIIDKLGVNFVPSDTTRVLRQGEVEGKDMFFRDNYDDLTNELVNGEFVQVAVGPAGDFYATRGSAYPDSGIATLPVVSSVVPIFRNLGFKKTLTVFIVPPTLDEWMVRIKSRTIEAGQLNARLQEAKRSFDFSLRDNQTHFILNKNLDDAVDQTKDLLEGIVDEKAEKRAKLAAEQVYKELLSL